MVRSVVHARRRGGSVRSTEAIKPSIPVCDAATTAALLDFDRLTNALERAACEMQAGTIVCPERQVVPLADDATLLSMPAVAADLAIHKLITVASRNASLGLPTIQGAMTVLDPRTGRPLLVLDGPTVTGRRTAAVSLCALERLAPDARSVLLIGTGTQALHHLVALGTLRPGCRVRVRGTTAARAAAFCEAHHGLVADLAPASDDDADVVVTCTTSQTPVWHAPARACTLIIAVGSFRPHVAEVAAATVRASTVVVDDLEGARHEAGDLILAGIEWRSVMTLADLVGRDGRPPAPALFKSVGCAAWDLAAGRVAWSAFHAT